MDLTESDTDDENIILFFYTMFDEKIPAINSIGKNVATYLPDNSTYLLNLKGIVPGLYFLKIYCLNKEYNKKIQILR